MVYLDNAATTRPSEAAIAAGNEIMRDCYANPHSLHDFGISAEKKVEEARQTVAAAMGVPADCLYFTSGGTMSDNIAIRGFLSGKKSGRIITSSFEHPAVLECFKSLEKNFDVVYVSPDKSGKISAESVLEKVTPDTALISVMHINNETGAINEIGEIAEYAKRLNVPFHTDAVQAFLKTPFRYSKVGMASVSGHKVHGPKGVGALYIAKDIKAKPVILGGGQERNIHSGTVNTQGIVAFAAAVKEEAENLEKNMKKVKILADRTKAEIKKLGGIIISPENASDYIVSAAFKGYIAENILHYFSRKDIFVSTGSACSSKKGSHVMASLGLSEFSKNTLRISFSSYNSEEDVEIFTHELKNALGEIIHS